MKPKSIINDLTLDTPDLIEEKRPPWYSKLCDGCLFGKRKDALILRIMDMGGMDLLESECGFAVYSGEKEPPCEPKISELILLERRLRKEQAAAAKLLHSDSLSKAKIISSGEGMLCLSISIKKQRKQ